MAVPFLAGLSSRARRAWPIIRRAVREGLSANQTQLLLSRFDLGIRRQTLLDLRRRTAGIEAQRPVLRALRRDRFPNPERLSEAVTKIRRAFSFQLEVTGQSLVTGESMTRFVTITTDTLMTRAALEDLAGRTVAADVGEYELDLTGVQLTGGLRAGPFGIV